MYWDKNNSKMNKINYKNNIKKKIITVCRLVLNSKLCTRFSSLVNLLKVQSTHSQFMQIKKKIICLNLNQEPTHAKIVERSSFNFCSLLTGDVSIYK